MLEAAAIADPDNPMLFPLHLPPSIRTHFLRNRFSQPGESGPSPQEVSPDPASLRFAGFHFPDPLPDFKTWRADLLDTGEKAYMERLLATVQWDLPAALDISGLSQSRLYYYLKKFNIPKNPPDS